MPLQRQIRLRRLPAKARCQPVNQRKRQCHLRMKRRRLDSKNSQLQQKYLLNLNQRPRLDKRRLKKRPSRHLKQLTHLPPKKKKRKKAKRSDRRRRKREKRRARVSQCRRAMGRTLLYPHGKRSHYPERYLLGAHERKALEKR